MTRPNETTPDQHEDNTARQYLNFKQQVPAIYARILAQLDPAERATVEAAVARLEAKEANTP
jgi:uncharacterized protein (DUF736 family)